MSEAIEAKRDGATLIKNSGRGIIKGDALIIGPSGPVFTIDYKEGKQSFAYSREVWAKICQDAWHNATEPVLKVILGEGDSKVRTFIVSEEVFHDYIRLLKEEYYQ